MAINVSIGTVVGREIIENRDSENESRMLSVELSEANDVQSIEHINQNGEQTNPPDDTTVLVLELNPSWKLAIAINDLVDIDDTLDPGEKKIYAVDSGNNVVAWIYLKGDGSIRLDNDSDAIEIKAGGGIRLDNENGSIELTADGNVVNNDGSDWVTQFTAMKSAFDTLKSDLNTFITTYNTHVHSGVMTGGGSSGPTPSTGTSSTADMSDAKVETVLVP